MKPNTAKYIFDSLYRKQIWFIAFVISLVVSCGDFGDINDDPNNPKNPETRYLFTDAVRTSLPSFQMAVVFGDVETLSPWNQLYSLYITWRNAPPTVFDAVITLFAAGPYYTRSISDLEKIIEVNSSDQLKNETYVKAFCESNNNQIAVARTLKAYIYMHLTDALGMIPYSQAMKASQGIFEPQYDDQQFIYTDLDKELSEAYAQFDEAYPLDAQADIVYGGEISKWKKFNASVRMMLAIKLAKNDAENGKTRFAKAFNDGFIRNNEDIFQFRHLDEVENQHPLSKAENNGWYYPTTTVIDTLQLYQDPRLEKYVAKNDLGNYVGLGFLARYQSNVSYSYFHSDYYKKDAPAVLVTPSVLLFASAEAAERGWITANASDLYKEAIAASFNQHDIDVSEVDIYYEQPLVKYEGSANARVRKIAMQKWIASYMQDGFESFSDYRRFGVPIAPPSYPRAFQVRRTMYHPDDYIANEAQYKTAISKQGEDTPFIPVWWNK